MSTNNEKLIEDYLSIRQDERTYDFAKPIEDEDIFGSIECDKTKESDTRDRLVSTPAKDKYKELAKGLIPKKFAADCDENGMIDIGLTATPEPESTAKSIFEKAALRKVKDKYGLFKGQKLFWDKYNDYLLKKISADKRKRWDSFQHPPDRYDDEEELIEDEPKEDEPEDGEPEGDGPEDEFEEDELGGDEFEDELGEDEPEDEESEDVPIGDESEDELLRDKPNEVPKINESEDEPSEDEPSGDEPSEDEHIVDHMEDDSDED